MPKIDIDSRDEKKWRRSLIWCPTQIYRDVFVDSLPLELYLRWRWTDPFYFYINIGNSSETSSKSKDYDHVEKALGIGYFDCLFERYEHFFIDKDYKKAEKAALEIWYNIEKPRIREIIKDHPELLI